jgi:ribosomal protein S18 acetylase RimI-like enzyme
VSDFRIEPTTYEDAVATELREEMAVDIGRRYGKEGGDAAPISGAEFWPPAGGFFVVWLQDRPAGCVGWRTRGPDAEMKRLWVRPEARGRGIARALIATVEESARAAGLERVILETGLAQPEAIELYESAGYQRIADYGYYAGYPDVRSYARDVSADQPQADQP